MMVAAPVAGSIRASRSLAPGPIPFTVISVPWLATDTRSPLDCRPMPSCPMRVAAPVAGSIRNMVPS